MRILFVAHTASKDGQRGYSDAFARLVAQGGQFQVRKIPFLKFVQEGGWKLLWEKILKEADDFDPDVVFFQHFHGFDSYSDPARFISALKGRKKRALILISFGDLFTGNNRLLRRMPPKLAMEIAEKSDALFTTCLGDFGAFLKKQGIANIVFLPNAYDASAFLRETRVAHSEFDVVMLGSCSVAHRVSRLPWSLNNAMRRRYVARLLWKRYGKRFAVFGYGWNGFSAWKGGVAFQQQMSVFQRARLVVDAPAPIKVDYYASDRAHYIAGSGVPLVMQRIKGFDRVLKEGELAYYFEDLSDVVRVCDHVLNTDPTELEKRRDKAIQIVHDYHSFDCRVDTILSVVEALRSNDMKLIRPWHFGKLQEKSEDSLGLVNWQGMRG